MGVSYWISAPHGGGAWVDRPARASALWEDLEALTKRIAALDVPAPDWDRVRYRREGNATSGPRRGGRDDRWLPPWELPRVGEWLEGDCEDLAAWTAASLIRRGYDARPAIAEYVDRSGRILGWHALVAVRDPRARLPAEVYAGPDLKWGARGWRLLDPSHRAGMFHPDYGYHRLAKPEQREPRP